jgi:hypothetical protein
VLVALSGFPALRAKAETPIVSLRPDQSTVTEPEPAAAVALPVRTTEPTVVEQPVSTARAAAPAVLVRPGPDLLYAPAAHAPQLENTGIWTAAPILVSGASAYRSHELVYQDHLYDDTGADGTYVYPTDAGRFANNAADLVEVRVKQVTGATAFRLTYNTMLDPEATATTLALGGLPGLSYQLPHGSNGRAPGEVFVTVHGIAAAAVRASTGEPVPGVVAVSLDRARRQVTVIVPSAVFSPGRTMRLAAATGLWDAARGEYLLPQPTADATHPGGARSRRCAFTNAAFRFGESGPWENDAQNAALGSCDLSPFHVDVDAQKLAGADDDMTGTQQGVPQAGRMTRIYASRLDLGQGRPGTDAVRCDKPCGGPPHLAGPLQP